MCYRHVLGPGGHNTHVLNLSEFKYDPSFGMQPIEVAARNAGEFYVEKIIDPNG